MTEEEKQLLESIRKVSLLESIRVLERHVCKICLTQKRESKRPHEICRRLLRISNEIRAIKL